ncbi:MAG: radical SAM family heme chaperone HemW [Clostridiales bacterium]|nr:radical SAM family heme chaperone HemW [Clostridiales bacterium]
MNVNTTINKGTWKRDLRLYVHVPFCVKKCDYCDFLSGPTNKEGIRNYFDALYKEIRSYKDRVDNYMVSSIFIGGGTPSCVDSAYIVRTLEEIKDIFEVREAEITIEINPGTVDREKLKDYYKAGINRISYGLQSTNDYELKLLGRIHTYLQFLDNYKLAREIGFTNISVDLMSALPGQNLDTWKKTLQRILAISPEHISAYSLIIEEGTPFYDLYGPKGSRKDMLPDEDTDRLIYKATKDMLESFGYKRYEISNYAKTGYESSHNLAYWNGNEYLGLGLGSSSLISNNRFHNTYNMKEYISLISSCNIDDVHGNLKSRPDLLHDYFGIREELLVLSQNEQMEEFMFLGLRKTKGISKGEFLEKFDIAMEDIYKDKLINLEKDGLIYRDNDRVWLTDYGIDISNRVLAEFLLD